MSAHPIWMMTFIQIMAIWTSGITLQGHLNKTIHSACLCQRNSFDGNYPYLIMLYFLECTVMVWGGGPARYMLYNMLEVQQFSDLSLICAAASLLQGK